LHAAQNLLVKTPSNPWLLLDFLVGTVHTPTITKLEFEILLVGSTCVAELKPIFFVFKSILKKKLKFLNLFQIFFIFLIILML